MEKLKFKHVDGVFGTHLFFGILKIRGFVYVRMNLYFWNAFILWNS